MKIRFMSIGSGSCGNCYYLGVDDYGILIDAGIPSKTIRAALKKEGVPFESICAVFVTHDHADHIKSLGVISSKANIPIYATKDVHRGINNNYCMSKPIDPMHVRYVEKGVQTVFRSFVVTPFEVPHDGTDNVGYFIEIGDAKFCIATDLGFISDTASYYIEQANHLVIEANYEEQMLLMGRYPQFLKDRVAGMTGHLSNQTTAKYLAKNFNLHLKNIWLCHLSEENNHPELAYKTVEMEFASYGIIIGKDVKLNVLKRATPSPMYNLE
ncbi:MAG: MBL fold metallo-hydrolase [Bacteroidaceae bacterium]|nr:MBL fold metallo-hydrolase [Bacteroidaceae bacterium]